jgi:hypothetical protein
MYRFVSVSLEQHVVRLLGCDLAQLGYEIRDVVHVRAGLQARIDTSCDFPLARGLCGV